MTMTTTDTPRVWIGCLASYNAGRLIGEWTDATDAEEMYEAQKRVAAAAVTAAKEAKEYPIYFGEPEEFFIADYDNFPGQVVRELGEYPRYETVANVASALEEHGEPFAAWLEAQDYGFDLSADDLDEQFQAHYRGEWDSEERYAMEVVYELGWSDVPAQVEYEAGPYGQRKTINVFDELSGYLDWETIARDMFQHGNYTSRPSSSGVYVFEDEV